MLWNMRSLCSTEAKPPLVTRTLELVVLITGALTPNRIDNHN